MNWTHSFSFRAIRNLARNPEVVGVEPDKFFTRFCLLSNDFVVEDPVCRCCITSVWFVAVDGLGNELSVEARKGDQLIVEGMVLRDHWSKQKKRRRRTRRPTKISSSWSLVTASVRNVTHLDLRELG